jgi:hypothetical protein
MDTVEFGGVAVWFMANPPIPQNYHKRGILPSVITDKVTAGGG